MPPDVRDLEGRWARDGQNVSPKPSMRRRDSSVFSPLWKWIAESVATSGACGESFDVENEVLDGGSLYTVRRARERMIFCLIIGSLEEDLMAREAKHVSRCVLMSCTSR